MKDEDYRVIDFFNDDAASAEVRFYLFLFH
jgi:hypothetical protein